MSCFLILIAGKGGAVFPEGTLIKKKIKIFLIHREIQSGAVAKSYMRKGFLIYEEMSKYFPIDEEAVSHILQLLHSGFPYV
jgi:hypothetical protein